MALSRRIRAKTQYGIPVKSLLGAAILALIVLPSLVDAQGTLLVDGFAGDVITSAQSEYVVCAAYFSVYLKAPDLDQRTIEQFRSHWFGALSRATSLLERVTESVEAAQEMILTQFETQFNGMMAFIDGDFSKIAMLNRRHRERCEAVMEDSGLDSLISEKFFQKLSR